MDDPQDDNTMGTPPADDGQAPVTGSDDDGGMPKPTASEPETPAEGGMPEPTATPEPEAPADQGEEAPAAAGGNMPPTGGDTDPDAGSTAV